ncbi:MAG: response regulator [Steroidobacteraceae bacterium]|jgi:signal transduction histidine kinase
MRANVVPVNETDKVKILLVDDQQAKLLSYEVVLAGIGETLIKASSACEAFEFLLRNEIGLILIDVCMPDLDGFKLAALIRDHPRFQRTGIIFVSAVMTTSLDQLRGYELGAFDYVPVPWAPEQLRAKVKMFVDLYRKARQLERLNAELEQRVQERTFALCRLREQLEQRVEERTREREQALTKLLEARTMDTVGEVTGEVAHDFNNLIMAVLGSLALLQKHLPDDPDCRRLLHNAIQGGQRGASLATRLLAFSRRRELKPVSVDVGKAAKDMEELLIRALGVGIELRYQIPRMLPPVLVDVNQLELALLNVALNARDAMPNGGELVISAEETNGSDNASLPSGKYVRIKLADIGAPVDEATRANAAEPTFTEKGLGMRTGLGLSVADEIAAQSGGLLSIDRARSVGTIVELWLPQSGSRLYL